MLFGEHAVVYGRPCLVTAVNHRISVTAELISTNTLIINAPQVEIFNYETNFENSSNSQKIPHGVRFVVTAVQIFSRYYHISSGIKITTQSEFSSNFGFGSSSAVTVGTILALARLFQIKISKKELFNLSYQTVLEVQGTGSGFDLAAAVYGGTLFFITGGKTIIPLKTAKLPLIVGYTGLKADTTTLVKQVAQLKRAQPQLVDNIFDDIAQVVKRARTAILQGNLQTLGLLMNINQGLLDSLGVNTPELSSLIFAARSAGAHGAKLSGAGGGDCMICLAPPAKRKAVAVAIQKAGGIIIDVKTNAQGI